MKTSRSHLFSGLALLSALAQLSSALQTRAQASPPFCRDLECPNYKVVMKTDEFEERCYKEYKWASTDISDVDYDVAVRTGFERLFAYISGANKQKVKIEMTAPVAIEIKAGPGPFCASNFTENFFVPFKYQVEPPMPTGMVYITTFKEHCQYVISYPGFSNITLIQRNAEKLVKALAAKGLADAYDKNSFFFAGYDSPFQFFDRHNEVWFIKKNAEFNNVKA